MTAANLRKLRERLAMNQVEFGQAIGRSYSRVRQYESGAPVSPKARRAIVELAEKHGLQDLIEDLIQELDQRPSAEPQRLGRGLHEMLDLILSSGDEQAIAAVSRDIQVFHDYVRLKKGSLL